MASSWQTVAEIVAVVVVVVVAVEAAAGEVGIVVVAVEAVGLEPCAEADEQFPTGFGKIGFAAVVVDGVKVRDASGFVRLAVKIPLVVVGWVMCDPAVAAAFVERCVAEVVADGHPALTGASEKVLA